MVVDAAPLLLTACWSSWCPSRCAVPRAAVAAAERLVASVGRPALHARLLGFAHPATGEELTFDRGPPPDFEAALAALRAWGDAS